jgi:hypothetical protein
MTDAHEVIPAQSKEIAAPQDQSAAVLQVIERAATNPDVDIDKMERLLQMHERMSAQNASMQFNAAMSLMQTELPEVEEKGVIKHGEKVISTYAKWEDINAAIKPVLQSHGFALSFRVNTDDKVKVEGVLSHKGGHSERTSITLPIDAGGAKNAVQAVASSVSYGKRYVAGALLNLTSSERDDDGQAAVDAYITQDQQDTLQALIEDVGADKAKFLTHMRAEGGLAYIRADHYDAAVRALEKKRGQA